MQEEIRCRWAPSLGELEATAEQIWGTKPYHKETDQELPCVFFGLYGFKDFQDLWNHKGKRYILWAGSDITHFRNGYWLDVLGEIRLDPRALAQWISKNCESFVENEVEQWALRSVGIEAKIVPSFLGDVNAFPLTWHGYEKPKLYTSVSGDNFFLYGWDRIVELADQHPEIEFHFYGNTRPFVTVRETTTQNLFFHGRVPKEQMNKEIAGMQGAIRMTEFDGFSEILAKSVLMGQWPVSLIKYPHILSIDEVEKINHLTGPNVEGREYYLRTLNQFPWTKK